MDSDHAALPKLEELLVHDELAPRAAWISERDYLAMRDARHDLERSYMQCMTGDQVARRFYCVGTEGDGEALSA